MTTLLEADPTMDFVSNFDNPAFWDKVQRSVPIFVEHETSVPKPDSDDKITIKVDEHRLGKIVARMQAKERSGIFRRITAGHIKFPLKDIAQKDQPPLVGYGRNARLGRFGPKRQLAILEDQYILKGKLHYAQDLPYRSPEFYPAELYSGDKADTITGVALLRIDPRLDMGMVTYTETLAAFYAEGIMPEVAEKKETPSEEGREPIPKGDQVAGEAKENPNDPTQPPNADAPSEEDRGKFMSYMQACYPHLHAYHEHLAKSHAEHGHYGMGMPSGTNGHVPGEKETMPATMQADLSPVQYAQLQAENKELRASVNTLAAESRHAKRRKELEDLSKGFPEFNVDEELQYCQDLPPEQYAAYLGRAKAHLNVGPVGTPINTDVGNVEGVPNEFGEAELKTAIQYMEDHPEITDHDKKWKAAREHAMKGKKRK